MAESRISDIELVKNKEEFSENEDIVVNVKFSVQGQIRDSFNEKNWTHAYNNHDNLFKMKYGVKLTSGGIRKHSLGKPVDSYRKASIFWTRNPKLVNPMKDRRIWVQVAKNFEPFIRLTEDEVRQELFDFDEQFSFKASELGSGTHKLIAEVNASWQKHSYTDQDSIKNTSKEFEIRIN